MAPAHDRPATQPKGTTPVTDDSPVADPSPTLTADFLDAVATKNIAAIVDDAVARQAPATQIGLREALRTGWRVRPTPEGLVVVVAGQDLASITWDRVFSSSGSPDENN